MKTVIINPSNLTPLASIQPDTTYVFQSGKTYKINSPININAVNVSLKSDDKGAKPIIMGVGSIKSNMIGIGQSAKDIALENLVLTSDKTTWGTAPNGSNISGTRVSIKGVELGHCYYGFNITDKARTVSIQGCSNQPNRLQGYFVYTKGKNITVKNCVCLYAGWAFVRCNLVDGLTIDGNSMVGDGQQMQSRITIQKGSNIIISNNRFNNTGLSVGPLSNCDGLRGDGSVEAFLAARTTNVQILNNEFVGKTGFAILNRTENVLCKGNNLTPKVDKGVVINCDNQRISLPDPINLVISNSPTVPTPEVEAVDIDELEVVLKKILNKQPLTLEEKETATVAIELLQRGL